MKTLYKETLPKCDFCGSTALYDAPTVLGPWANMCSFHFTIKAAQTAEVIGFEFEVRKQKPATHNKVKGNVKIKDDDLVVTCPSCKEERFLEPDACGSYMCRCGDTVTFEGII